VGENLKYQLWDFSKNPTGAYSLFNNGSGHSLMVHTDTVEIIPVREDPPPADVDTVKEYKESPQDLQVIHTDGQDFVSEVQARLESMSKETSKVCATFWRKNATTLYMECIDSATSKVLDKSFKLKMDPIAADGSLTEEMTAQVTAALDTFKTWVASQNSKRIKQLRLIFTFPRNSIMAAGSSSLATSCSMGINTADTGPATFQVLDFETAGHVGTPQKEVFDGCSCCVRGFHSLKVGSSTGSSKSVKIPNTELIPKFKQLMVKNDPAYGSVVPDTFYAQYNEKKQTAFVKRIDADSRWGQNPTLYLCIQADSKEEES